MGFFKKFIEGGPKYMDQDIFNTVVFKTYSWFRPKYDDFDSFWDGVEVLPNGDRVETVRLFRDYMSRYDKDDLLGRHFAEASELLEEHLESEFGLNLLSWQLVDLVANQSDNSDAEGNKIKSTIHLNATCHPNPILRPERLILDFKKYTLMVNK